MSEPGDSIDVDAALRRMQAALEHIERMTSDPQYRRAWTEMEQAATFDVGVTFTAEMTWSPIDDCTPGGDIDITISE